MKNFTIEVNYCDCVRIQVGYFKCLCNGEKKNFSQHFIVFGSQCRSCLKRTSMNCMQHSFLVLHQNVPFSDLPPCA